MAQKKQKKRKTYTRHGPFCDMRKSEVVRQQRRRRVVRERSTRRTRAGGQTGRTVRARTVYCVVTLLLTKVTLLYCVHILKARHNVISRRRLSAVCVIGNLCRARRYYYRMMVWRRYAPLFIPDGHLLNWLFTSNGYMHRVFTERVCGRGGCLGLSRSPWVVDEPVPVDRRTPPLHLVFLLSLNGFAFTQGTRQAAGAHKQWEDGRSRQSGGGGFYRVDKDH